MILRLSMQEASLWQHLDREQFLPNCYIFFLSLFPMLLCVLNFAICATMSFLFQTIFFWCENNGPYFFLDVCNALDDLFLDILSLILGCLGYWLSSQYVIISSEGESKGSHCWMVIPPFRFIFWFNVSLCCLSSNYFQIWVLFCVAALVYITMIDEKDVWNVNICYIYFIYILSGKVGTFLGETTTDDHRWLNSQWCLMRSRNALHNSVIYLFIFFVVDFIWSIDHNMCELTSYMYT